MELIGVIGKYSEWMQFGRQKPVTKQTIETIQKVMRVILASFGNCDVKKINEIMIMDLKRSMFNRGSSIAYVEKILIYVRSLLRYCQDVLKLKVMKPEDVKLPTREKKIPDYYTNDQILQIFQAIDISTFEGIRTVALICTILSTGMRISEVLSLKRTSIDRERRIAVVLGKGRKEGVVFFHRWCLTVIDKYLLARVDTNPMLFVANNYHKRYNTLTPDTARNYLQELSKVVGFQICPHKLRRTAATCFRHNGGDIFDIQHFLRHSEITTTQSYVGVDYRKVQHAHSQYLNYGPEIEEFFLKSLLT